MARSNAAVATNDRDPRQDALDYAEYVIGRTHAEYVVSCADRAKSRKRMRPPQYGRHREQERPPESIPVRACLFHMYEILELAEEGFTPARKAFFAMRTTVGDDYLPREMRDRAEKLKLMRPMHR